METEAKKKKQVWITTVDNPFDPFTQFKRWYDFDYNKCGYDTCGKLAQLANLAENMFDCEHDEAINFALARMLDFYAPLEIYRLVFEGETQKFGLYSD